MRSLFLAAFVAAAPPAGQGYPVLHLCPPTVHETCFIGYVTAADKMIVLLSTAVNDPMIDREVEVHLKPSDTSPDVAVKQEDLSGEVGHVVMLDAVGGTEIDDARLAFVADPILTALYLVLAAPPH